MSNRTKLLLPLILILPLLLTLALINLSTPAQVRAGPLAGFTPSPPDDGDDGDDSSDPFGPTTPADSGSDELSPDYVYIQMDRCNLSCSAGVADSTGMSSFQPLAAAEADDWLSSLLVPITNELSTAEVHMPVQLIHDGSGWIAEAVLSDQQSSRVSVPYPGQWEVWLVGEPELIAAEAPDMSGTNLLQLQNDLADGPVSLGTVEANTGEPQLVKCPLACVIEASPVELPPTGEGRSRLISLLKLVLLGGIGLVLIGLIIRLVARNADPLR